MLDKTNTTATSTGKSVTTVPTDAELVGEVVGLVVEAKGKMQRAIDLLRARRERDPETFPAIFDEVMQQIEDRRRRSELRKAIADGRDIAAEAAKRKAKYDAKVKAALVRSNGHKPGDPLSKSLLDMTVRQIAELGLDGHDAELNFVTDDITLDLYDIVRKAHATLNNIEDGLQYSEQLKKPLADRGAAAHERWMAERKAEQEARAAAEKARLAWEPEHPQEALEKFRLAAIEKAKEDEPTDEDGNPFDVAAFEAAMAPDEEGWINYSNPLHDFYARWRKEHHTIFPGHLDEEPAEVRDSGKLPPFDIPADIDIKKLRKLTEAVDDAKGKDAKHKAKCALAVFLKVDPPTSPDPWNCDYKIDPADVGRQDRENARHAWLRTNARYLAAERAAENMLWRIDDPKGAAEQDKADAEQAVKTAKRIKREAKNAEGALEKARTEAQRDAFEGEYDPEDKDEGETKADYRDRWIEENWEEHEEEFLEDFNETWEAEHGAPFPGHKEAAS